MCPFVKEKPLKSTVNSFPERNVVVKIVQIVSKSQYWYRSSWRHLFLRSRCIHCLLEGRIRRQPCRTLIPKKKYECTVSKFYRNIKATLYLALIPGTLFGEMIRMFRRACIKNSTHCRKNSFQRMRC